MTGCAMRQRSLFDEPTAPEPRNSAAHWVAEALQSCCPPGLYRRILSAHFEGRKAVGVLEMFDGETGEIEVERCWAGASWSFAWRRLDGGSSAWNGTEWERVPRIAEEATTDAR